VNGTLTVIALPTILTVQQSGTSFIFTCSARAGQPYQIQAEPDLSQSNWTNLGSAFAATNCIVTTSVPIGTNSQQFYRIILCP
jgi:hypothetical protein